MKTYSASVWQDGQKVAGVVGKNKSEVRAQAMHYALMYGQDGPVKVRFSSRKARRRKARMKAKR